MKKRDKKPIYVTQPYLPPLEEFTPYLQKIWDNKILTNGGPFHKQLEKELCEYLGVDYISLFANGTLALVAALKALNITGEVITTPYSFVATAHSLVLNDIKPVFVDIDPRTLNLDPSKIEDAITPQTSAIMAVHCYGRSCDTAAIQRIADRHNLKVIYDGAHAFGINDPSGSILNHGDLSALSFHATKIFNTFEGGAIVSSNAEVKNRIDQIKNFGFEDECTIREVGINGKMSEVNAAFGILQLKHINKALLRRREIDKYYRSELKYISGISCLNNDVKDKINYSYFPVLIEDDYPLSRDELYNKLQTNSIYARRYFYPLISDFSVYKELPSANEDNYPIAKDIANKILCLPISPSLEDQEIDSVIKIINNGLKE